MNTFLLGIKVNKISLVFLLQEDINLSDNPDPNTSLEIKQFPPDIEQVAEEIKQVQCVCSTQK